MIQPELSEGVRNAIAWLIESLDGDRIEIKLIGNDGFGWQEILDGREHMKKWIREAISAAIRQDRKEREEETCEWTRKGTWSDSYWETTCGERRPTNMAMSAAMQSPGQCSCGKRIHVKEST